MKVIYPLLFAAIVSLGGPVACGGGGGNPGVCDGSDAVCGMGRGSESVPGATTQETGTPAPGSASVTCASFGSQAEAQAALAAGARQLDPNNNGIACDE